MTDATSRRDFMKKAAIAGLGAWMAGRAAWATSYAENEKLNIAGIGVGGRGEGDIRGVRSENIVALCDVDENRAGKTFRQFPTARKYKDYRAMLQEEERSIEAVVVATPDHNHALASIMAMRMGKHCYCEKPLTHNVREARMMREIAAQKKLATQMGNQGTSSGGLRQGVEIVQSGAIGEVREVHIWTNRPIWPQGFDALLVQHQGVKNALTGSIKGGYTIGPPPDSLAWDLWLGPAAERPYDSVYCPFKWRGWWDFGTGALGDMACHTMNLPYWALKLGAPTSVESKVWELNPQTAPRSTVITYEFPARGNLPPVTLTWYDGKMYPSKELFHGERISDSGSLMVGTKGKYYSSDDYGDRMLLLPKDAFKDYRPPSQTIPRSPGHHREWIEACKGGKPAFSNFDYAGPLTEMVLLGVVATRANGRIEWDAKAMKVTNDSDANRFVTRQYRKGWEI